MKPNKTKAKTGHTLKNLWNQAFSILTKPNRLPSLKVYTFLNDPQLMAQKNPPMNRKRSTASKAKQTISINGLCDSVATK